MAETTRNIQLKLRLVPAAETKKSLDSLKKVATDWDKVFGPNGDKPVKNQKRQVGDLRRSWDDLGRSIKLAGENFKEGFKSRYTEQELDRLGKAVDKLKGKWQTLKTAAKVAVVGGVLGAAYIAGKSILEEGSQDIKLRKRLAREFGAEGKQINDVGERVGKKAGLQGSEATSALIPLSEQLQAIQEGAIFRGMKKKLTADEATKLRKKNLEFGGNILQNIATMVPEVDSETLGRVLGDALAGPEGIRSLVSTLNLSKRSKTLAQLNEKGNLLGNGGLTPAEAKRFGITGKGQYLQQGDLVQLLLQRSGITEAGAEDTRKTFDFQLRSIKATLGDLAGDIGSSALDTLTEKLGKGATAAERFQNYLASDEGKKTVDSIKDTVVKIGEGIAGIVQDVPKIGKWLSEHKTLLELLAAAYVAAKAAPALGLAGKTIGALDKGVDAVSSGAGGGLGKLIKVGGRAVPVALAGYLGYKAGEFLDDQFQLSDRIAGGAVTDRNAELKNRSRLSAVLEKRKELVSALEDKGIDHGLAVRYAEHPEEMKANPILAKLGDLSSRPIELVIQNVTHLDGQVIAKNTERHFVRQMDNRTARGASPVAKE